MTAGSINKQVGERIANARKSCGWNQDELAEKIDRAKGTIHNYENGNTPIPVEEIIKIAKATNLPPELIAFGTNKSSYEDRLINELQNLELEDQAFIRKVMQSLINDIVQKKRISEQLNVKAG